MEYATALDNKYLIPIANTRKRYQGLGMIKNKSAVLEAFINAAVNATQAVIFLEGGHFVQRIRDFAAAQSDPYIPRFEVKGLLDAKK
jgi:hypothetical protein